MIKELILSNFQNKLKNKSYINNNDAKENSSDDIFLLAGDASTRSYWRWKKSGQSYIVTQYPEDITSQQSFERYVYWQKKYHDAKIKVPQILEKIQNDGLILQEDIGIDSLQTVLGNSTPERELKLLELCLEPLQKIVSISYKDYEGPMPQFDEKKLQYEINNTLKYFLGQYLEIKNWQEHMKLWVPILNRISALPKVLCHRDYHSRNLMVKNETIYVIDFQDSMLGPIQYDLCSLLDDCYIKYHPGNYQTLMRKYYKIITEAGVYKSSYDQFFEEYHLVKIQRQYKAIGSFCYVWSTKKSVKYLRYISYVMESIKSSFSVLNQKELIPLQEKVLSSYYEY